MIERKRFYKQTGIQQDNEGYAVTLDGKPIRSPAGAPLRLAHRPLASAIAAEWDAQGEKILPQSMPCMQLASTALDRVAPSRAEIVETLLGYVHTDLLCYRAATPEDLAARQAALWQPILDWAEARFGAPLEVTSGLMPITQPEPAVAALRAAVDAYDLWRLTALSSAAAACGSLVLGLAVVEGRLSPEEAFAASQLDETYQIEYWGDDAEAAERRAALAADVKGAALFLSLLRD